MNGEVMVEWEGVRVEVPGFLGATSSPIAWVGAVLSVVGAVMIARRLGVSALWTYGVGAVMFGLASGLGTFALIVEDSADVYLVGAQFIRDMFLVAAIMGLIGLVCFAVGWRASREAATTPRTAPTHAIGLLLAPRKPGTSTVTPSHSTMTSPFIRALCSRSWAEAGTKPRVQ